MTDTAPELTGARSEEPVRTVTFSSSNLTTTILISPLPRDRSRIDGWIAPADLLRVEVRSAGSPPTDVFTDADGRFVVDDVPTGEVQLLLHATAASRNPHAATVAAPPLRL